MSHALTEQHRKNIVESKDGTLIGYDVTGDGPGLIVVPGVMSVAEHYAALADELGKYFTVYTIERRGRGISGPQGEYYSITKEAEDVRALQECTLAPYLFGHSYGGLIALETFMSHAFKKAAVYEPGVSVNHSIKTDFLVRYEHDLLNHRYLNAFALMTKGAGPPTTRKLPLWLVKLFLLYKFSKEKRFAFYKLLPANLNEQKQIRSRNNTYVMYSSIGQPVLLMRGKKTRLPWAKKAVDCLKDTIPGAQSSTFEELNHFGPQTNSKVIAEALKTFFLTNLS